MIELVAEEGMDKRSRARLLAFGVNGAGVALMVAIFAHTGGLTGAEVGVAGGTSVVAQRLLEGIIGDDAVRSLAERAKTDLDSRIEALMASEAARFEALLASLETDEGQAASLREAVAAVESARTEGYTDERAVTRGVETAGELTATTSEPVITVQQVLGDDHEVVEAELVEGAPSAGAAQRQGEEH